MKDVEAILAEEYPTGSDGIEAALDALKGAGWFDAAPPQEWQAVPMPATAKHGQRADNVILLACFESCSPSQWCADEEGNSGMAQGALAVRRCDEAEKAIQRWYSKEFPEKYLVTARLAAACDSEGVESPSESFDHQRVSLFIPLPTSTADGE